MLLQWAAVQKTTLWSITRVQTSEFGADKQIEKREQENVAVVAMLQKNPFYDLRVSNIVLNNSMTI